MPASFRMARFTAGIMRRAPCRGGLVMPAVRQPPGQRGYPPDRDHTVPGRGAWRGLPAPSARDRDQHPVQHCLASTRSRRNTSSESRRRSASSSASTPTFAPGGPHPALLGLAATPMADLWQRRTSSGGKERRTNGPVRSGSRSDVPLAGRVGPATPSGRTSPTTPLSLNQPKWRKA